MKGKSHEKQKDRVLWREPPEVTCEVTAFGRKKQPANGDPLREVARGWTPALSLLLPFSSCWDSHWPNQTSNQRPAWFIEVAHTSQAPGAQGSMKNSRGWIRRSKQKTSRTSTVVAVNILYLIIDPRCFIIK